MLLCSNRSWYVVPFQVGWLCDVMLPSLKETLQELGAPGVDNPMDVIFCHNDLQEGNWLVGSDKSLKVCLCALVA